MGELWHAAGVTVYHPFIGCLSARQVWVSSRVIMHGSAPCPHLCNHCGMVASKQRGCDTHTHRHTCTEQSCCLSVNKSVSATAAVSVHVGEKWDQFLLRHTQSNNGGRKKHSHTQSYNREQRGLPETNCHLQWLLWAQCAQSQALVTDL